MATLEEFLSGAPSLRLQSHVVTETRMRTWKRGPAFRDEVMVAELDCIPSVDASRVGGALVHEEAADANFNFRQQMRRGYFPIPCKPRVAYIVYYPVLSRKQSCLYSHCPRCLCMKYELSDSQWHRHLTSIHDLRCTNETQCPLSFVHESHRQKHLQVCANGGYINAIECSIDSKTNTKESSATHEESEVLQSIDCRMTDDSTIIATKIDSSSADTNHIIADSVSSITSSTKSNGGAIVHSTRTSTSPPPLQTTFDCESDNEPSAVSSTSMAADNSSSNVGTPKVDVNAIDASVLARFPSLVPPRFRRSVALDLKHGCHSGANAMHAAIGQVAIERRTAAVLENSTTPIAVLSDGEIYEEKCAEKSSDEMTLTERSSLSADKTGDLNLRLDATEMSAEMKSSTLDESKDGIAVAHKLSATTSVSTECMTVAMDVDMDAETVCEAEDVRCDSTLQCTDDKFFTDAKLRSSVSVAVVCTLDELVRNNALANLGSCEEDKDKDKKKWDASLLCAYMDEFDFKIMRKRITKDRTLSAEQRKKTLHCAEMLMQMERDCRQLRLRRDSEKGSFVNWHVQRMLEPAFSSCSSSSSSSSLKAATTAEGKEKGQVKAAMTLVRANSMKEATAASTSSSLTDASTTAALRSSSLRKRKVYRPMAYAIDNMDQAVADLEAAYKWWLHTESGGEIPFDYAMHSSACGKAVTGTGIKKEEEEEKGDGKDGTVRTLISGVPVDGATKCSSSSTVDVEMKEKLESATSPMEDSTTDNDMAQIVVRGLDEDDDDEDVTVTTTATLVAKASCEAEEKEDCSEEKKTGTCECVAKNSDTGACQYYPFPRKGWERGFDASGRINAFPDSFVSFHEERRRTLAAKRRRKRQANAATVSGMGAKKTKAAAKKTASKRTVSAVSASLAASTSLMKPSEKPLDDHYLNDKELQFYFGEDLEQGFLEESSSDSDDEYLPNCDKKSKSSRKSSGALKAKSKSTKSLKSKRSIDSSGKRKTKKDKKKKKSKKEKKKRKKEAKKKKKKKKKESKVKVEDIAAGGGPLMHSTAAKEEHISIGGSSAVATVPVSVSGSVGGNGNAVPVEVYSGMQVLQHSDADSSVVEIGRNPAQTQVPMPMQFLGAFPQMPQFQMVQFPSAAVSPLPFNYGPQHVAVFQQMPTFTQNVALTADLRWPSDMSDRSREGDSSAKKRSLEESNATCVQTIASETATGVPPVKRTKSAN